MEAMQLGAAWLPSNGWPEPFQNKHIFEADAKSKVWALWGHVTPVYEAEVHEIIRWRDARGYFVHALSGGVSLATRTGRLNLMPGQFGQFPCGELVMTSLSKEPSRLIIMFNSRGSMEMQSVRPRLWDIESLPLEVHTAGVQRRSLWKYTELPPIASYEFVTLDGVMPNHRRTVSSTLVRVICGQGTCTQENASRPQVHSVRAGSIVRIPSGTHYRFRGQQLTYVVMSYPEIAMNGVTRCWDASYREAVARNV